MSMAERLVNCPAAFKEDYTTDEGEATMAAATLRELTPNLWVADRGLKLIVGDIGTRMTMPSSTRRVSSFLQSDFDRVIVTHGEVLETDGHARLAAAFAFV